MSHSLRVIFAGTPEFASSALTAIHRAGFPVPLVLTQPDRPAGRGMKLQASPVKRYALEHGLALAQPPSLRRAGKYSAEAAAAIDQLRATPHDVMVVAAYGLILPEEVLDIPPSGCINIHASLLPRWRGAAPINRAVMAGDAESGVMVMRMDEGLDTGPIAMAERVPIAPDATAGDLHDTLAPLGADLMVRALGALERGTLSLTPQAADGVEYATKIDKGETRIDWTRPWHQVHDHIRGLSPFPGAWFEIAEGKPVRVKVLRSTRGEGAGAGAGAPGTVLDDHLTLACGDGAVRILELQRAGARAMKAEDFLRGTPLAAGTRLG
jgi:methionyl-tRNA formyltransferase